MRLIRALGLMLVLVVSLGAVISDAQELTKTNRQGPVTVAVTLSAPPVVGVPFKARVVLDTHSVGLDGVAFESAVVLRGPDGVEVAPTAVEQVKGSGHHREAVVVFPPFSQPGPAYILVKAVGGVAERVFAWEWR
ncbi:MAG TPA: hypothetical protein VGW35_03250 [Methylomirabilota bacterium]|jgi:hypothetical protein|nr:hypothetical protein [Methylomirabilota bacterium]